MTDSSAHSSHTLVFALLTRLLQHRRAGVLGMLFILLPALPANASKGLVLAVHPYLSTNELLQRHAPLARYLAQRIGRDVQIRVGRSYAEHQTHIGRDLVDIAFLGPAIYVSLVRDYGPKPLLARLEVNGEPHFRGAVITAENSGIGSLEQIRGRRFAFGDPDSTMSHLVPRHMLRQAGIELKDLADYGYLGSHTNVALSVLAGDYAAGAVKEEVFNRYVDKGLRVVAWSPSLSEHLFVTRSDLDAGLVRELRQALLELKDSPGGQYILQALKPGVSAMVPVNDRDYDNLRDIMSAVAEAGL